MDPAAFPSDSRITATAPLPALNDLKGVPTRGFSADIGRSWPRAAQWTTAVLLGGVLILLGIQVCKGDRDGKSDLAAELLLDANRATRAELLQVPGVGPALADRIVAYRRTNGPFRNLEDLRRVPGIGPATFQRLGDYVFVDPPPPGTVAAPSKPPGLDKEKRSTKSKKEEALAGQVINVNRAGLLELQKLPGIGAKLSQRIVDERGRKPFASVNDLRRVAGIGPKTLEKLRPYVAVADDAAAVARIE